MDILRTHKKELISAIIIVVCIICASVFCLNSKTNAVYAEDVCVCDEDNSLPEQFYVDIKGAVKKPGVYLVNKDNIIKDIIDMAGGLKSNASTSNINLAEKVTAEMVIVVNTKSELTTKVTTTSAVSKTECTTKIISSCDDIASQKLININTASKEELMNIPNIGASKADSIIIYRAENKFNKIEDIMNVSGIGEALFVKIKDHITV